MGKKQPDFFLYPMARKGANVEIIVPNPVVFQSSPMLSLSIQSIDAVDLTLSMS